MKNSKDGQLPHVGLEKVNLIMQIPSPRQVAEGIHNCLHNAEEFIESAEILYQNNHYGISFLLVLYSLEEMGKIVLIWNCLFHTETEEKWKKWQMRFRDHSEKFWFSKDLDDFFLGKQAKKSNKEEQSKSILKEDIAYVNFNGNKFSPPKAILKTEANRILEIAHKRLYYLKVRHSHISKDEEIIKEAVNELKGLSLKELQKLIKSEPL